ncbi:glycerate kinase [Halobacteriales archaeon QS_3_64_16]|nr:MAG: glycerate kinase [Halobacteriales archaeon QS_3_64_16]
MIHDRDRLSRTAAHEAALACIEAGIEAARPARAMRAALDRSGSELRIDDTTLDLDAYTEIVVLGGGKAAAGMARAVEEVLGDRLDEGVVVTNDPAETERVQVIEGSHPTPDEGGMEGAQDVLALAERATEETLVLCPLSGGGSALLPAPVEGVGLGELQSLTEALLASGARIEEINAVRKHLSVLKGGRLATAAAPATVIGLLVSDVVGNDLGTIASGPIVPDESTYDDALTVLERYAIDPAPAIREHLDGGAAGEEPETPGKSHPAFERTWIHVLADGFTALEAARSTAEERGYTPVILSSRVEGEAREAAKTHAAVAEEARATGNPAAPPVVFLSGGETTVEMCGDGLGGPNQEFVLSGALTIDSERIVLASVDTDGSDGASDAAGAIADRETTDADGQARTALAENDAYSYLAGRNAVIGTGPTGTNVNDLRVLVVGNSAE